MKDLKSILKAIVLKDINYGLNKDYCFVTDEDGVLVFLKRIYGKEESEECWPVNHYDGEVIWEVETSYNRGLEITELFLQALEIEFLG